MSVTSLPLFVNYLQFNEINSVCVLCNYNTKLRSFIFCLSSLLATEPTVITQNTKHAEDTQRKGGWLIILVILAQS